MFTGGMNMSFELNETDFFVLPTKDVQKLNEQNQCWLLLFQHTLTHSHFHLAYSRFFPADALLPS